MLFAIRSVSNLQKDNAIIILYYKVAQNSFQRIQRLECRIVLNFAKSCILYCLSKFYNKKKFHRAVFEIKALKAEIKGVFSR